MFRKDAGGGGAQVPGGATPTSTLSGAPADSMSPSPKRCRPAASTSSQVAERVSAGVRSWPGDQKGWVDTGGALRPLLGAHSRSTSDPSGLLAPGSGAEGSPGARPRVL